jgi:ribosomal protein S1
MKQLEADPWEGVAAKYPVGTKFTGRVTNITDYGAFVELEPGVEGLVHVSEMSWTKKNVHPGKIVSTSQEVEVMVLDVDEHKRRISWASSRPWLNPWEAFLAQLSGRQRAVDGEVKNITEFGLFVGVDAGDIDGMVHLSDLDWVTSGEEASRSTTRATWSRSRCSTSTSTRSASASASSSSARIPSKEAVAEYGSTESGASLGDILGAAISEAARKRDKDGDEGESDDDK